MDAHDGPQAFVDKGLQFAEVCFCYSPRFRAVKKDRLYVGIKYPYRGYSFERNCVLRRWESETLK